MVGYDMVQHWPLSPLCPQTNTFCKKVPCFVNKHGHPSCIRNVVRERRIPNTILAWFIVTLIVGIKIDQAYHWRIKDHSLRRNCNINDPTFLTIPHCFILFLHSFLKEHIFNPTHARPSPPPPKRRICHATNLMTNLIV